jgi:heptosyltransferase I
VRLSALGDVCLMLPLVRTLQKALPDARITWVIGQAAYALLEGLPGVEFVLFNKDGGPLEYLKFYRQMRSRKFDVLLATQASWRAHLLYPALRAKTKIGFDRQRERDAHRLFVDQTIPPGRQHLLDSFLSFAAALGIRERHLEWGLPIAAEHWGFADEHLGRKAQFCLAINPSASKASRTWLPERYAEVIAHVATQWHWRVVLTGGPAQEERVITNQILDHLGSRVPVLDLVGRTTPKQLAAVLARVNVLLAPDTGPVHIATAMGTPVIGLYVAAPPELSGPYLWQDLVINRFPQAVKRYLGLNSETVPWGTRVKDPEAMSLIEVSDVLARLNAFV